MTPRDRGTVTRTPSSSTTTVSTDAPAGPIDHELVLAGVSAGISVQDASGRLLYVNEVAARMAGFDSPELMMRASAGELVAQFSLIDEAGQPCRDVHIRRPMKRHDDRVAVHSERRTEPRPTRCAQRVEERVNHDIPYEGDFVLGLPFRP